MKNTQHKNNRDLWFENEDGKPKGFGTVGVDVSAKQANREIGVPGETTLAKFDCYL